MDAVWYKKMYKCSKKKSGSGTISHGDPLRLHNRVGHSRDTGASLIQSRVAPQPERQLIDEIGSQNRQPVASGSKSG